VVGGGVGAVDGVVVVGVGVMVARSGRAVGVCVSGGVASVVRSSGVDRATVGRGGSSVSRIDGESATRVGALLPSSEPKRMKLTRAPTRSTRPVDAKMGR
jgi:hypothetical protein